MRLTADTAITDLIGKVRNHETFSYIRSQFIPAQLIFYIQMNFW